MPDPLPTPTPPKPAAPAANPPAGQAVPPVAPRPASTPVPPPAPPAKPLVTNPPAPKPTAVQPAVSPVSVAPVAAPTTKPPVSVPSTPPSVPLAGAVPPANQPLKPPAPTVPGQPVPGAVPAARPAGIPGLPPRPPLPGQPGQTPNLPPAPPIPGRPPVPGGALPPAPPAPPVGGGPRPATPPTSAAPAASTPQVAKAQRSSILRFLPFILGGLAILGVIVFLAMRLLGGGTTNTPDSTANGGTPTKPRNQTTLTYWGLWEPTEVMSQVFADFEQANPQYKVNYVKQSHLDYRQRLQTAISQGNGPDLFRFHASWTPMLKDDLANLPSNTYSAASFQSTFYPVAYQQLQAGGQLKGVPLMYDGLALYYNEDMLKTANEAVPKTWAELRILANKLTVRNGNQVQRGGLAIGNASNVEHFADILGLLMLQNGADPTNPTSDEAEQALIFYTDFVKKYNVWSDTLPNSTVAFARGDAAMMLAPSWRAHEVLAQNPNLKFGIAPVPQLGDRQIAWASYWAEGVNSKSSQKDGAWKLIQYMSSQEVMRKMYAEQAEVRRFGEIYSRQDMANELSGEPLVVSYLTDAPNARGTYLNSFTHDSGINDQVIKYYQDAINAVMQGTTPTQALTTVAQGVTQVLRQYGVTSQSTTRTSVNPTNF